VHRAKSEDEKSNKPALKSIRTLCNNIYSLVHYQYQIIDMEHLSVFAVNVHALSSGPISLGTTDTKSFLFYSGIQKENTPRMVVHDF